MLGRILNWVNLAALAAKLIGWLRKRPWALSPTS